MDIRMMELTHDMKAPIQLICSCAQMLEMELKTNAAAAQHLQMLLDSAQDLRRMVLAVLDGGEADRLCWETRDIVPELRLVVRNFTLPARSKGVELAFSANARSFRMRTDALKLRRMMENLIGNALKATPTGGRIEVQLAVRGDAVDLIVSDNGCGIARQDLPLVMAPGYTTGGHGYGLAIVEKYARMLSGCLYADSEAGAGSVFTVHLPVQREKMSV